MGRALGNNLINMTAYKDVKEALEEMNIDLNVIEDQEPDAALGNGGLGRLAACFLDSLATLNYPAYGCGIRYRYGMFKQKIKDGYQVEVPVYYNHSDYVGGMKETTLAELLAKKPEKVIELAVKGMLPKGPMGRDMIKKLHVYAGAEHANHAQKPEVLTF